MIVMCATNSAVLLAYSGSSISERTPTQSHQCKHWLFFLTLETITNAQQNNARRQRTLLCVKQFQNSHYDNIII